MNQTTTRTDAAPEVPDGWPPGTRPAFVIVVGPKVTWVFLVVALGTIALLATIAIRLDELIDVVAVQGRLR